MYLSEGTLNNASITGLNLEQSLVSGDGCVLAILPNTLASSPLRCLVSLRGAQKLGSEGQGTCLHPLQTRNMLASGWGGGGAKYQAQGWGLL